MELTAIWLTLKLASITTLILLVLGTPLAWWLAHSTNKLRPAVEALTAMPLVMPPTVIGFYLLLLFSPDNPIGQFWFQITGDTLTFSFSGLVVASLIYSLPFMVQPLMNTFAQVGKGPIEVAIHLGRKTVGRIFKRNFAALIKGLHHRIGADLCPHRWRIRRSVDGRRQHSRRDTTGLNRHLRGGRNPQLCPGTSAFRHPCRILLYRLIARLQHQPTCRYAGAVTC